MSHDTHLQGLLGIDTFHTRHVVRYLSCALTEAHHTVVKEGSCVAVGGVGVTEPCLKKGGRINACYIQVQCKQRHAPWLRT